MIRTRNFLLFILLLAFLVGGIMVTLWSSADTSGQSRYTDMIFGGSDTATMTAVVVSPEDQRESRLAALRTKLAKYTDVAMAPSTTEVPQQPETTTSDNASTTAATLTTQKVNLCSNYRVTSEPALTGLLTYSVANGQRTFNQVVTQAPVGSSTEPTVTQTSVFTLPLRTTPNNFTSCLSSNVVAVTPTGAPIVNTDAGKYRSSGEATLIGYTIDGFELYGNSSSMATDECGGALVSGVYRYYLSSERETMLNCFAAIPVAL